MDEVTTQDKAARIILGALDREYPEAMGRLDNDGRQTVLDLARQIMNKVLNDPDTAKVAGDTASSVAVAPYPEESPEAETKEAPLDVIDPSISASVTDSVDIPEPLTPTPLALLPDPAPDAEIAVTALRPGEIPHDALPPVAPPPPRLRIEIERNARAGEPYRSTITARTVQGAAVEIRACEIPEEAGVRYEDGILTGESPVEGEYILQLTCMVEDGVTVPITTGTVLLVNPDPRSLWKNIPSDRDAPGWKVDSYSKFDRGASGRRLVAASQRGRSHAHTGGFRDDDVALHVTGPDGWNILAVADGAGSAKRSRIGSRVAVDTAVGVVADQLAKTESMWPLAALAEGSTDLTSFRAPAYQVLGTAAFEAVKAIEARAAAQGCEPRDYATTLLLALHRPLGTCELIATFWVGDGAIALLDMHGGARMLGKPDGGEFAGQTRFLDREAVKDGAEINRRIEIAVVPRFDALLLMTDGVSDPWFPSDAALYDSVSWQHLWSELAPLLDEPDAPEHLLDWLEFWSSGNHDDRTLAVLW